ncbi:MAG: hypothetical protein COA50_16805 [Flavobacteriaceae bacterium]|nr:MAG: hypothetical protein COA50_16805 [Flavobacteriaceae bacterium]
MQNNETPEEPWKQLYISNDIHTDLAAIYTDAFLFDLAPFFDKSPLPFELIKGVHATARAYIKGKVEKAAHDSTLLKYTGVHLIEAGVAAKQLQYSLQQLRKSPVMEALLFENTETHLNESTPRGLDAYKTSQHRTGPDDPLAFLRELSNALSEAANDIIPLPHKLETDAEIQSRAKWFVTQTNADRKETRRKLAAHHALEQAARTFRPTWEQHSTKLYTQGRYHHDRGGYDSKPVTAFHKIIEKIDSRVAESLAGTAIKNVTRNH